MDDLAVIKTVLQQKIKRAAGEGPAAGRTTEPVGPSLADDSVAVEFVP
jgi:hypothetical protein